VFEDGETLKTSCLFVAIGVAGSADLAKKIGANTDGNRIVIDDKCCTNLPWLFSAGDCCGGLLQVCKAVYEGAEAATSAIKYLRAKAREEKANANKVHVEVKDVDKKTWAAEVLEANSKVLVDFYGDGCVPCAALMPFIHSYADVYGDKIKFTSLNTSKARRLAMGEGINGLPVIAIYENGKQIDALHKDDATPEAVEAMIQKHYDA
jgi:thioredoxin 1